MKRMVIIGVSGLLVSVFLAMGAAWVYLEMTHESFIRAAAIETCGEDQVEEITDTGFTCR